MSITIRKMREEDIDRVREIAKVTWKATYSELIPLDIQEKTLKEAYSDDMMRKRFETSLLFVAEDDGVIAGYAFYSSEQPKEIYLESIYIHPDHQGKGIGKKLYEAGPDTFKQAKRMMLTVYKGNDSIHFYEKLGFVAKGEIKSDFSGHPIVFIKMEKTL
ncbi:GNAT family N-acetyltransferase [Camelliibacillus cellulosilyticus]|uniref:GNAT family N-acetyltransferase n=1 Tax=Camelliibacillus cellulosilyticus TaxID=2174486 RepID=A0ABV9GP77_9BACL